MGGDETESLVTRMLIGKMAIADCAAVSLSDNVTICNSWSWLHNDRLTNPSILENGLGKCLYLVLFPYHSVNLRLSCCSTNLPN